jgi:hypothetical protein
LRVPEKSLAAVNNQRQRLKRAGRLDGVFRGRQLAPWTIRELNALAKLTREYGFSAAFIAQLQLIPGRTVHAISKMMARHGLGNPDTKRRAQNACRLTAEQRRELQQFLLHDGRLMPSARVAAEWGLAEDRDCIPPSLRGAAVMGRGMLVSRLPAQSGEARPCVQRTTSSPVGGMAGHARTAAPCAEGSPATLAQPAAIAKLLRMRRTLVCYQRFLLSNEQARWNFLQYVSDVPVVPIREAA